MKLKKEIVTTIICVIIVGFTIVGKIFKSPQVVEQMDKLALQEELLLLAGIEILALLLYVFPKTFNLGFFLLTAYYGGAIAVNLNSPLDAIPAIVFLALIWILTYIRKPKLFLPNLGSNKD
ncbi:MAG: DoxX family protein [Cyclobacteriaceae bacterium]